MEKMPVLREERKPNKSRTQSVGNQSCKCKECGKVYTIDPKHRAYPEEVRKQAMKTYFSGVSGRGVGKIYGMNKSNVMNWIKKEREK